MSYNDERKLAESYPKCSDDEARARLYPVQADVANIPTLPMRALRGRYINVNESAPMDRTVSEAIRDMLRCALPEWIMNGDPCPEDILPEESKLWLHLIEEHYEKLHWPDISEKYGFYAPWPTLPSGLHFNLLLHRALSLSTDLHHQCATENYSEGFLLTPSLVWTPAYDTIFEYIEHDVLRDVGIAASFRPRWSTYPNQTHSDEWPVIIPDVVFSLQIPGSEPFRSPFTERAHKYHPAHDYDDSNSPVLDVPLLLVEYNKCRGSTPEVGFDPHLDHLRAGMTAALALYDALGIRTPVFGLLVGTVYEFGLFAGVLKDGRPVMYPIWFDDYKSIFEVTNSIQMLHLYTVLANLQTLSAKVSLHLKGLLDGTEADLSPLQHEWPTRGVPVEGRRVIDRAHPPLIVDDPLLQFLFSSSGPKIAKWLLRGKITLSSMPASIASLPLHVREWLHLFTAASSVSPMLAQDAVEDCKKGMLPRTQDLVDSFWSAHSADLISRGAPDAPEVQDNDKMRFRYIGSSLLFSMSACSRARDLLERPLNRGHSLTNSWLTLYRTLFTGAAACFVEMKIRVLRYNHQWAVHRCLRSTSDLETLNLDEIRPEMAFLMPVKSICWRGQEWKTRCRSLGLDCYASHIFADLDVSIDLVAEALAALDVDMRTLDVDMPISVVEYVLTPNNAVERKKHVAHLAVSMRSALAIWEMHQPASTAAVLGFLLDRNTVNVFVGWMDKNKCIIQELSDPDFTFDISDPSDAYRLFTMLRLQGEQALFDHVNAIIDAHISEAVEAFFREDYRSWKEVERTPSGLYNMDNPAEGRMKIESWRSGVLGR
ncbi:hypothetical protein BDZ89DRAFT_1087506 [Hymenopellis radicata]|nr:hypothetical protein BDZ89DRAFT_1087506 [Hymenopellis radicata]